MTNAADNCGLLLTNHKHILTQEPHCSPCYIMPSSGAQVNYFSSLQTLSAIRYTGSSTKYACASRQAGTCLPEVHSRGRGLHIKNIPCKMNVQTDMCVQQVLLAHQPIAHSNGMKTAIFLLLILHRTCRFHTDVSVCWLLGEQMEQIFSTFSNSRHTENCQSTPSICF
jgi:hypothetical protein